MKNDICQAHSSGSAPVLQEKRCTKCQETKPLDRFYFRRAADPTGPRRSSCKACDNAATAARRRNGPSLDSRIRMELLEHGSDNPEALSPEVRDAVFTERPIDPKVLADYRERQKAEARREKRRQRARRGRNQYAIAGVL